MFQDIYNLLMQTFEVDELRVRSVASLGDYTIDKLKCFTRNKIDESALVRGRYFIKKIDKHNVSVSCLYLHESCKDNVVTNINTANIYLHDNITEIMIIRFVNDNGEVVVLEETPLQFLLRRSREVKLILNAIFPNHTPASKICIKATDSGKLLALSPFCIALKIYLEFGLHNADDAVDFNDFITKYNFLAIMEEKKMFQLIEDIRGYDIDQLLDYSVVLLYLK